MLLFLLFFRSIVFQNFKEANAYWGGQKSFLGGAALPPAAESQLLFMMHKSNFVRFSFFQPQGCNFTSICQTERSLSSYGISAELRHKDTFEKL